MLETARAMIAAWSADRVGVRLSPSSFLYGVDEGDKLATFGHAIRELDALGIGYPYLLEPNAKDAPRARIKHVAEPFRDLVRRAPPMVNGGFDKVRGDAAIASGPADLVAFGVSYIANPDFVKRLETDAPLNKPNPALFYGVGAEGYTDYPALAASPPALQPEARTDVLSALQA